MNVEIEVVAEVAFTTAQPAAVVWREHRDGEIRDEVLPEHEARFRLERLQPTQR